MNKIFLSSVALLTSLSFNTASAQLDSVTQRQVYNQTYQQLGIPEQRCVMGRCPASGVTDDNRVEEIFSTTYIQTVGSRPDFDEFLQWKYLSDYPISMRVSQGTAAVREMPRNASKKNQSNMCPKNK